MGSWVQMNQLFWYIFLYIKVEFKKKHTIDQLCMFCEKHGSLIPLTFVLAFYVSHVVQRYWDQVTQLIES